MTDNSQSDSRDLGQGILARLAKIQYKVDSLEQTQAFALRVDGGKHLLEVEKIFNRSSERARVYLAADGRRNVQAVATHLGMKGQNVSVALRELGQEGLLEVVEGGGGNAIVWTKTSIGRTLRITRFLCKTFGLDEQGRRLPGAKKNSAKRPRKK